MKLSLQAKVVRGFVLVGALTSLVWLNGCSSSSNATDSVTTDLSNGNQVFSATFSTVVDTIKKSTGVDLTGAQAPKTIILTCSDSRVPPELVFNKTLGDLFVIRVAGNVLDKDQLASIEYAVEHKWANKIILLGHTKCGAVKEATQVWKDNKTGFTPATTGKMVNLENLIGKIYPSVKKANTLTHYTSMSAPNANLWEASIDENTNEMYVQLMEDEIIKEAIADSANVLKSVIKAKYDVTTGKVSFL